MTFISSSDWDKYKKIINDVHNDFNQDTLTWYKSKGGIDRHGEDNSTERFQTILLKCLIDYDDFKKWSSELTTVAGELDRTTMAVFLNMKYLSDNGYLNNNGNFNFNIGADRFKHRGINYKAVAGTKTAQAKNEPLLFMLVLQTEETSTGVSNI